MCYSDFAELNGSCNGVINCYLNYLKPGIKGLEVECWQALTCRQGEVKDSFLSVYTLKIIWSSVVNYFLNVCIGTMNNSFTNCFPNEQIRLFRKRVGICLMHNNVSPKMHFFFLGGGLFFKKHFCCRSLHCFRKLFRVWTHRIYSFNKFICRAWQLYVMFFLLVVWLTS